MASTLNPSSPVAPPRTSLPPPSERADEKNEITPPVTNHASIHIPLSVLLSGVTGQVQPGTMMAVMGPSGAGKSTFLDVMARRRLNGASGKICLGDEEIATAEEMGGVASYVEQRDDLLGVLTVRESIAYAARLRLPTEPIITSLGLTRCANQILGNPIQKGVSGGQKRRVTIGMSLVTYPKVLFLDEPTSGLDATTSREVMGAIARIAQEQGMIVIATIHQPNFETLSLFSSILILAEGKVMYNGDLKEMDAYFEAYGTPIPRFVNPSDHAIDLINTDFDAPDKPTTHVETLSLFYRRHADAKDNYIRSCVGMAKEMDVKGDGLNGFGRFMRHTMILSERMALSYVRNLLAYGVRVGMYLGMGIMMATIWVRLGTKDSTINDRMSVHFFSVAFLSFMSVAGIPAFLEERSVFVREKHNGLYKAGPYALANSLVNIPFLFLCAFLFTAIAYWAIGLNGTASAFFRFLGFLFLAIYTAESQTVLISALIPIFIAALAIGAFMNGFWMCVQGYFIKAISLPRFWYYSFHFMDYQRYAFELLANNDLRGLNFDCAPNPALNGTCQCAYPSSLGPDACTVSGDDVLQYLDIKWISLGHWSAILIAIGVIYRILFYIVLARSK
ncbi:P-loop containing nucleoside triphosphate hydrolase protein [Chytridium lagenaria]|nr:P-loop containing nucleoside triphosphate hydrolase protein [Chytridium lagenaria]